eukprot:482160_1
MTSTMSLYHINDLVAYVPEAKGEESFGRILDIKQHKETKEIYLTLCEEYRPSKMDIILEDDVIRAIPIRENRYYHIHSNKSKHFVHQIQGYPRRILNECYNASVEKEFVVPRNYKKREYENMCYSNLEVTAF